MNETVTARDIARNPAEDIAGDIASRPLRQQLLARYDADSLETMTAAQLRDAVDYLLAGFDRPVPSPAHPATTHLAEAPSKYEMETNFIELAATLSEAHRTFKQLERDFYLAAFGRYEE